MNYCTAVIGTGFIGPVHVEALRRAGVSVTGILGSSPAKSVAAAESLHLPRAYQHLEEILLDKEVDCIHITSPNQAHFAQATASLKAGKHVLCEKPLAMNSTESAQLVALAEQTGLAAGVNYNIRYYPLCIEAAERQRGGGLGNIYHVQGSYVQDWLFHRSDYNWRVSAAEGGPLRAVADIGTHWLDLVQTIVGSKVQSVMADLQIVFPERDCPTGGVETFSNKIDASQPDATETVKIDTEDAGNILLRFECGARGCLHVSQVTAGRKNCLRFDIAGSKQSISWNSEQPNQLWAGRRDQPNESLIRDPALMHQRASDFSSYPAGHNEGFSDTFKQLFIDFYSSIGSDNPSYPTFADGHQETLLCEAILQSAKQESWVSVN
ncbi:MAG: Gfo/Idh/MocA family oxidoreductase [Planctomycetota bacterium]|nr:Gfo/Idh/MocA family oxidoreductase [Planctomycetota bacterium]